VSTYVFIADCVGTTLSEFFVRFASVENSFIPVPYCKENRPDWLSKLARIAAVVSEMV
jgi:hypothetical protein